MAEAGTPAIAGYASNEEHLLDALHRIDRLIYAAVTRLRSAQRRPPDEFQGLYIPDEEVDRILGGRHPIAPDFLPAERTGPSPCLIDTVAELARTVAGRAEESVRLGVDLRLMTVVAKFGLSDFDTDALLVCLAPELDLRYERLYAYLQDDVTKRRPSVDLVLNLLCASPRDKLVSRRRFTAGSPLIAHGLLDFIDDPAQIGSPLLARYLAVDEGIVNHLLGSEEIDPRLSTYARWLVPESRWDDLVPAPPSRHRLALLAGRQRTGSESLIFHFRGPPGTAKLKAAEVMCAEAELPLLVVSVDELANADMSVFLDAVRLAGREAMLRGAAVYWDGVDNLWASGKRSLRAAWLNTLAHCPGPTFVAGCQPWQPGETPHAAPVVHVPFGPPGFADRLRLWHRALDRPQMSIDGAGADLRDLANTFRLSGGQIEEAVASARGAALLRDPADGRVTGPDLREAAREHASTGLSALARRVDLRHTWGDLVLPAGPLRQLEDVRDAARYRYLVYEEWGFDRRFSRGAGLNVLFSGPSGTGKTMAAEVLSAELGLDLYVIDLSTVVSKYIGETEKHLARIFADAEAGSLILFFDEADALFGRRSDVRDAHDRYANVEVSHLLQELERHNGLVILATNLRKNMDEAFSRRMQFAVEFPFPSWSDRRRIWEAIWPPGAPCAPDLDLGFFARRFELSGGSIRNVAVAAALNAASEGTSVTMAHLLRAVRLEYRKLGRVATEDAFAAYGAESVRAPDGVVQEVRHEGG
ncbi:AAA family ATPase [Streptomyces sp. NRRL F-5755]|uniref:AAA family ATPase n=1 Tax=Streptomyces sp. NRRL F-5755 TaxID=1519475 RepID=UPI0006ADFB4C|nr:AAA family ATPase [Streptomyces sp. NRRL F-5755]